MRLLSGGRTAEIGSIVLLHGFDETVSGGGGSSVRAFVSDCRHEPLMRAAYRRIFGKNGRLYDRLFQELGDGCVQPNQQGVTAGSDNGAMESDICARVLGQITGVMRTLPCFESVEHIHDTCGSSSPCGQTRSSRFKAGSYVQNLSKP